MATLLSPDPPSYEDVKDHEPRHQLPAGEFTSLILDGCLIYPAVPPSRALYELTNPPIEAKTNVYGIEKLIYKPSATDGEGKIRHRRDHMYDFKTTYFGMTSNHMIVEGKTSRKRALQEVLMSSGLGLTVWKVRGHFKVEKRLLGHLKHGSELLWRNEAGTLLAVETRVTRKEDGRLDGLPRLDLKVHVDEKTMDLLVTCWATRVWMESQKNLAEPMTWEKFKRIASMKTPRSTSTPMAGSFAGVA